jgi:hypothetical protein
VAKMTFRLWTNTEVIGEWDTVQEAHQDVNTYIAAHPEDTHLLTFSGYATKKNKTTLAFSVSGNDIPQYLNDAAGSVDGEI